ncbi:MAG: hypothetical protein ACKV22_36090 [Bryobacteraceae bacterium]
MRPWVLEATADPNVSFLLAAIGVLGVYWELCAPGRVLPGATGGVLLLIGVFGLSQQAVRVSGLTLLGVGIALLLAAPFSARASQSLADGTTCAGVLACCLGLAWLLSPPIRIHPMLAAGVGGPIACLGGYLWMIAVRGTQLKSTQSLLR